MKALLACSLVAATQMSGCLSGPTQDRTSRTQDPSRLSHTRVYCTPDNESHFGTETLELPKVDAAPPAPHFFARGNPAARMAIAGFDAGWGTHDMQARSFHPAPSPQYVVYLEGVMTIMTSDGDSRTFRPGDVIRVEDTAPCKGAYQRGRRSSRIHDDRPLTMANHTEDAATGNFQVHLTSRVPGVLFGDRVRDVAELDAIRDLVVSKLKSWGATRLQVERVDEKYMPR